MTARRVSPEPPLFDQSEPAVTVLHASDLQFGKHHRFADPDGGFDTLLRRLCDDLDELAHTHALKPDLVALTGDLAEWGMRREFDQVAAFCHGLRTHLRLEPDRILIIPGNHDVNRRLCESYFLRCAGEGEDPRQPHWPKWEPYLGLVNELYRDIERYRFTELEPWTLFEVPSLKVVVAGLNSTIQESHQASDHYGFVGEKQLHWFTGKLAEYEARGWLRLGLVHHNAVRRAAVDDENLRDADDLREILGDRLHALLHGHTHQGRVEFLGPLPVISTGSAAVSRDQRPGPSSDALGETPNQYQLVRFTSSGFWCATREYSYERKRWIGDNRASRHGDCWWYSFDRSWEQADATFPQTSPPKIQVIDRRELAEVNAYDPFDTGADTSRMGRRGPDDDLLDEVIGWCRIREAGRIAEVIRVRHRGPWGDYAKVHDLERGIGLLGAHRGELTIDVLDRWVADVHEPFRRRGQPVSRLVVDAAMVDPGLRTSAQMRGVEIERMIDYQRVLDTVGYSNCLRDRLARDREYPSEFYLEQRMTVWNPLHASSETVGRAADWLTGRLLEREGAFVLVLGPAGVGKTFLLREVARRLGRQQAITPILVELRDLERARTIEELAATQFTRFGVPWHPRAFRRDLEEGRLALLFDGFDELALRVRAAAIPAHFERIYSAAIDRARIVITSRTEHFLSSGAVADLMMPSSASTTPLGGMLERVQRRHVLEVHPFERDDIAQYLQLRLGPTAGSERLRRLARVHDLIGLARNPRMLGFLVDIPYDKLVKAAGLGGSISSDALYRIVVDEAWLPAEAERLKPPGAAPGPNAQALRDAATNLALRLWRDPSGSIRAEDVGEYAGDLLARMCDDDPEWVTHTARVRTLLTRDDRGRFRFIHQTVLEWLVAGCLAGEITGELSGTHVDLGRFNTFIIDLLRERLGDNVLVRWAEARLSAPVSGAGAENARDVLKRLNRQATARAIHRDQDLRGQDLAGQSLRGAILDRTDLTGARLVGRDLTGASLVGAQLAYVDFTDACLAGADLTGANLAFARFHRAELGGAVLTGAQLTGASLLAARGLPAVDEWLAVGVAITASSTVEVMYTCTTWDGCRVAMHPDGALLASGHGDGTVRLWDCVTGKLVRTLAGHAGSVLSVAFSPDGKLLASGSDDTTVRLWNTGTGRERSQLAGHKGGVISVAFSPDGNVVASGGADALVQLWNVEDGSERACLIGHAGRVFSVAFSPDGQVIASGSADASVRLWSTTATDRPRARLEHGSAVWCVAFSPDGKVVASGSADASVRLWNVGARNERAELVGHGGSVLSVAFSPDGRTLASSGSDATVRLWSVSDRSERVRLLGHSRGVLGVAFSPDGRTVVSSAADDTVRVWNASDGSERLRLTGQGARVLSVAFSPDGKLLASGCDDSTVRVWNADDGRERTLLTGHRGEVLSVAFSPDGKVLASGSADEMVRLWNVEDSSVPEWRAGSRGRILSVAFSPDSQIVASSTDDTVRLSYVRDGSEYMRLIGHEGSISSVGFSPDGRTVVSGAEDATLRLWNVKDGSERARLTGHAGSVLSVGFSPDGLTVVSGADDTTVRLWNVEDGSERARLTGHAGRVLSVRFSPDGKLVASGGDDACVRLWDVASGRCLAILRGTAGGTIAARPDGRYRIRGDVAGQFWHVIGLHRYDVGELDAMVPGLRLSEDEPLYT